jgi:hypothetical protein
MASQESEKIHPRNDTTPHLTDKRQLMDALKMIAYVATTIGTSLRRCD